MNGIFYFSSTGNSLDIAQQLQECNGGKIHYIPKQHADLSQYDKLIIVSPIYSWGLPVPTEQFIRGLHTDIPCYLVLNYGGMAASGPYYAYKVFQECGLPICGIYTVCMPENFTLQFHVPSFYVKSTLKSSPKKIRRVAEKIAQNREHLPRKPLLNLESTYRKNRENWHKIADDFTVGEDCVHCGACVAQCPVQNITEQDGMIRFGDGCIACLGCYHRCPQQAINYKNQTVGKPRYLNPHVSVSDITEEHV